MNFQQTNDPRKGAICIKAIFGMVNYRGNSWIWYKEWGKKEVTVSGTYKAKTGDIIEIRERAEAGKTINELGI